MFKDFYIFKIVQLFIYIFVINSLYAVTKGHRNYGLIVHSITGDNSGFEMMI
jgi:hypothetical protein